MHKPSESTSLVDSRAQRPQARPTIAYLHKRPPWHPYPFSGESTPAATPHPLPPSDPGLAPAPSPQLAPLHLSTPPYPCPSAATPTPRPQHHMPPSANTPHSSPGSPHSISRGPLFAPRSPAASVAYHKSCQAPRGSSPPLQSVGLEQRGVVGVGAGGGPC